MILNKFSDMSSMEVKFPAFFGDYDRQTTERQTDERTSDGLIGKFHFNKDLLDYFVLMEFFIDSIYITNVQKNNSAVSLN